jgi:transposase
MPGRNFLAALLGSSLAGPATESCAIPCYGPWQTVYSRFRGWETDGTFDRILRRLQVELDERGLIGFAMQKLLHGMVDSTSVRASRAAAGAPNTETSKKGILSARRITPLGAPEAD